MRAVLAAACLLFAAAPAGSGPVAANEETVTSDLDAIAARLNDSAEVRAHYAVCPAGIAKSVRPLWRALWPSADWSPEACGETIESCHRDCMTARNEHACFALARVFEEAKPVVSPNLPQMIFAQACATGSRGGCTNRAAGIRNGQYEGDPMLSQPDATLRSCYYRTFTISCGDGDAWGCAMLGQSYDYGEGVERSAAEARRHYLRACEINPDFAACDFAKPRLEKLGNP